MCLNFIEVSCYIDNTLNESEKAVVKEHLSSCPKCQSLVNSLQVTVNTVFALPTPKTSPDFVDNLFARLDAIRHPSFAQLSDYFDNSLNGLVNPEIQEHLIECPPCQDTVKSIEVQVDSVSTLDVYHASDDFLGGIFARIDSLDEETDSILDEANEEYNYQESTDFLDGIFAKIEDYSEPSLTECVSSEDLSAYLDNEVTSAQVIDIDSHLQTCTKCKSKFNSFRFSREVVLNLNQPDVPFDFSRKVLKDIAEEEKKIIRFMPFLRRTAPRASMVAGIIIAGILVTMSKPFVEPANQIQATNISVRSEDFLFAPESTTYRTDSISVLADNTPDNSLEIEDIGL